MTELEKLKTQLKTVIYREADGHHRHGAIVDALEAENARLREALQLADYALPAHHRNRPMTDLEKLKTDMDTKRAAARDVRDTLDAAYDAHTATLDATLAALDAARAARDAARDAYNAARDAYNVALAAQAKEQDNG
jgi:hypothetical protein